MVEVKSRKIGPKWDGRPISEWEFDAADFAPGYKYELIDGRIAVSAEPEPQENYLEKWIEKKLDRYAERHPDVLNYVTTKGRVYTPGQRRTTIPEPDITCYSQFPHRKATQDLGWHEVSPLLVVEVLVYGDPAKDLERNVKLYLQVPSIKEYWVVDGRDSAECPQFIQHRRVGQRWAVKIYPYGSKFRTKLLPGFTLTIDPFA